MSESLFYNHQFGNEQFTYHHVTLPHEKPQRRLSFSTLLQKRPSLMGRKLSIFGRQKKPALKLLIPSIVEGNSHSCLQRATTDASNSTTDEEDEGPETPTSTSPSSSFYYDRTPSSEDLETAVTTPSTSTPLLDYSGKGYSNFYIKLPNGNWMVRIRDGNRKIVATYEIDSAMI